jgi:hypothetical protein
MRLRGLLGGSIVGLLIVALHGGIEGFQGGFAMGRVGGACAGTLEAVLGSAISYVVNLSPATSIILVVCALLGALVDVMIAHSHERPTVTEVEKVRTYSPPPRHSSTPNIHCVGDRTVSP